MAMPLSSTPFSGHQKAQRTPGTPGAPLSSIARGPAGRARREHGYTSGERRADRQGRNAAGRVREERMDTQQPRLESEPRDHAVAGRVPFGIARTQSQRIELVFALRQGGTLPVTHDLGTPVTAEVLDHYCEELRQAIAAGQGWWQFADAWGGSGQRAYLDLSQVVGFTARPVR
jgi:hypothetical protein